MPFGKKKNDNDADLESKKSSLFGARSREPAASSSNPYAAPPSNDPYAQRNANPYATQSATNDPYASYSKASLSQPPNSSFGSLTLNSVDSAPPSYNGVSPAHDRYAKSPVPQGGYGNGTARYPAPGNQAPPSGYGQSNGYGKDPYANDQSQSRYGAGGYGGMGRRSSQETLTTEAGRDALFGDAPKRVQQQQTSGYQPPQDPSYSNTGGYDSAEMPGGYGAPDRELTAEEQEEQEVSTAKEEIRFIKKQDVAALRNARRIAEQSEQIGIDTLQRLGQQGERIHNTERNLDSAKYQNRVAQDKASRLKAINRSMFVPVTGNPFTRNAREQKFEKEDVQRHEREKATAELTRQHAYASAQRSQDAEKEIRGGSQLNAAQRQKSLANRAKYQFEADSEDDGDEDEIDESLDVIAQSAKRLNQIGKAMGEEIGAQNKHLERISEKTDVLDTDIYTTSNRLRRIADKG